MSESSSPEQPTSKPDVFGKIEKLRNKRSLTNEGLTPAQLEVIKKLYPEWVNLPLPELMKRLNEPPPPPKITSPQNPPDKTKAGKP